MFAGDDLGKLFEVVFEELLEFEQHLGAIDGGGLGPFGEGRVGGFDCAADFGGIAHRGGGDLRAVGGIVDGACFLGR